MKHFILTGHGDFAPGIASALAMVAGDIEHFSVVPFKESDATTYPDTLAKEIAQALSCCDGCVVFCDLMGGTPFNTAMLSAAENEHIELVCGANLPMLIETVFARTSSPELTAAQLAEMAVASGQASMAGANGASLGDASPANDSYDDEDGI